MPEYTIETDDGRSIKIEAEKPPDGNQVRQIIAHVNSLPDKEKTSKLEAAGLGAATSLAPGAAFTYAFSTVTPWATGLASETGPGALVIGPVAGTLAGLGAAGIAAFGQHKAIQKVAPKLATEIETAEREHPYASIAGGLVGALPSAEASIPKLAQLPFRAGMGAAVATIPPAVMQQRLPTKEELIGGAVTGAVLGGPRKWVGKLPGVAAANNFILKRSAQAAGQSAAETATRLQEQERTQDASSQRESEEVHGPVRPQPIEGVQQVPVKEGGSGVQPQEEAAGQVGVEGVRVTPTEPAAPKLGGITPEHIGWDEPFKEPPWRPITDDEAASPSVLGKIITTDARIAGSKVAPQNTKRVLVIQSTDPNDLSVHVVSTYDAGSTRGGAKVLDPALVGKQKTHVQLAKILSRYKPIYSVLLKEPVKNFHQKFDSLQDFYSQFGDKATEMARGNVGVAPTETASPVAPVEAGSELFPTSAELGAAFKAVKGFKGEITPELLSKYARTGTVGSRQFVSTLKKLTTHLLNTEPNLEAKDALARAIDILHEHSKTSDTPEAFTKSVLREITGRTVGTDEPEFEDIGHTGETDLESRHGTPSGLPPGVRDGGPGFPAELMEASRRLGTVVKSKTNLPQNVEGRYRRSKISQDDSIEVGDIKNQLTVAHEMGHDVDALMFPKVNLANSQTSLVGRVGGNTKAMFNELVKVSELMRGQITGSKGHQAYRKRATELFADYFALYAHHPEMARAMAPEFSKGFEKELSANALVGDTVKQLHAGNVEPIAPQTQLPATATPAQMPGAVPVRAKAPPIQRDVALAHSAEDLVAGQVRKLQAEVQGSRIKSDRWREKVPKQIDRNDVGAFVEGIGNLEVPGDTIAAVESRMTPAKKALAKTFRFDIELLRQEINQYLKGSTPGEYLQWLEDYLPHFYANSKTPAGRVAITRFIKESPNAKQRKIPTLREAVEYGLVPISQDPAVLYETTARINWRVATNRKLLAELKNMQSSGQPIVMPAGKAPPGWPVSNNPLIQRVYARQTPSGTMLWRGGAAIHPDAWRAVRMMLDTPTTTDLGRAYDAINSLTRANAFAFALFHDTTLRSASLGAQMQWHNPLRGLFRFFERNPKTGELEPFRSTRGLGKELLKDEQSVMDAARHGLRFAWNDSASYQKNARDFLEKAAAKWRDVPYLGKSLRLARDLQQWRHEGLWKNTHDAYKIAAYEDLTAKALQDAPQGTDPKLVKEKIASLLNDAFGGQEWETKFWLSPQTRQTLARFFLAPDWTLSTLRSVPLVSDVASTVRGQAPRLAGREPIPTRKEGWEGNLGRARFWGAEIAALAMATIAAQYAIYQAFGRKEKGDKPWIWQNELGQDRRVDATPLMRQMPWHKDNDHTRYYINLGKRPEEILAYFTHPDQMAMSKMSRPVAEIFRQVTGTEGDFKAEWKRDHHTFIESLPARAKSVGSQLIPFSFSGNQFALSLPFRKGMTKYKAEQAFESAYEIAAEPSKFRSALRGQSPNTDTLLDQIGDAAIANGVDPKPARTRALSYVRGKYYDQYFKALQKNDQKGMDKAADALLRLGAGHSQINQSIQRKIRAQGGLEP